MLTKNELTVTDLINRIIKLEPSYANDRGKLYNFKRKNLLEIYVRLKRKKKENYE